MPFNVEITEDERGKLEQGGGLKPNTILDRERIYNDFNKFVLGNCGGKSIEDLVLSQSAEDIERLGDYFSNYFFTMRVPDEEGKPQWPKKGYAEKIKSNIKMAVIEKHSIDLTDPSRFPNFSKKWRSFIVKLVEEGRSETKHHEEVDPVTAECIYELLYNVKSALEARGTPAFDELIKKVPVQLHNRMHYIMQWGAQLLFILFEARRGGENLENMKKTDMAILTDPI